MGKYVLAPVRYRTVAYLIPKPPLRPRLPSAESVGAARYSGLNLAVKHRLHPNQLAVDTSPLNSTQHVSGWETTSWAGRLLYALLYRLL